MHQTALSKKNKLNRNIYTLTKKVLFKRDPEETHQSAIKLGHFLSSHEITKRTISKLFNYQHPSLRQKILGITFPNPVGLPGGFDKNALMYPLTENIGFGFVEIGSITAKPAKGNSGVRLKRIKEKQSLWVNLGLNNDGAKEIRKRIRKIKIPLGINIAKTNCRETADAKEGVKDYIESFKLLKDRGDYFTLNISCPNAFGGQPFTNPEDYEELLKELDKLKISKPIFTKLSPDLDKKTLDKLISISDRHNIQGFVCTNLTKLDKKRSGGYSGQFVKKKSNNLLKYIYKKTRNKKRNYIIIGSGGISSAEDAYEKIKLGASLVQLITGMIYQGPGLIGEINADLVQLLKRDGYKNISEAIGTNNI